MTAVGFDRTQRRFTSGPLTADHVPVPAFDGDLSLSEADLTWAATDFGRIVHHRPLAVLHARSVNDVLAITRFASEQGLPLVPRAQGHSTGGQAQAPNGIVLDMTALNTIHEITDDRVVVDAGACWSEVVKATLARGLTPPVLTDYLELSIGGTLSVGGLGGASHQHGAQTDNVLELDVVTPDGTLTTCSPNTTLFDAVRAGRGRHGVITRATLRLIPAHTHARTYRLPYTTLNALMADQLRLIAERRFDYLEGQAKPDASGRWTFQLEASHYFTPPGKPDDSTLLAGLQHALGSGSATDTSYWAFLKRLEPNVALLNELGIWQHQPHPWLNLLLPGHNANKFVGDTLAEVDLDDIGETGLALIYPIHRYQLDTPSLSVPDAATVFLFALLRTARPDAPEALNRTIRSNQRIQARAQAASGTFYLDGVSTVLQDFLPPSS